jgi:hypothetical protein
VTAPDVRPVVGLWRIGRKYQANFMRGAIDGTKCLGELVLRDLPGLI